MNPHPPAYKTPPRPRYRAGESEREIVDAIIVYIAANTPSQRTLGGFASFMRGYLGVAGLFDAANAFKALRDATPDRS